MYSSIRSNEPGVIWRCSLGRPLVGGGDNCEMLNIDPFPVGEGKRPGAGKSSPEIESHDGAWIGITMEINYGRLLTCGMRWNRGINQYYNGICYWFPDTDDKNRSSYRSHDLSHLVSRKTYEHRLTTFFTNNPELERRFDFIDTSNKSAKGHEWQLSEAGMSIHLFKDDELGSSSPNLLIGAPGVREFSGAVVLYTNRKFPKPNQTRPNRNKNDDAFSEYVVGNRGLLLPGIEKFKGRKNYWNEYFGYSVSSGKYFDQSKIFYASGAPRAEHSGKVIIFDIPTEQPPKSTYKRQIKTVLEISAPENSFASYFGSVIHSVDLDYDGVEELIVGAPLYTFSSVESKHTKEISKDFRDHQGNVRTAELGDNGCVFVYKLKNSLEQEKGNPKPNQLLLGSKSPLARFGSAISSLTFNLLAPQGQKETYLIIGAPYETNDLADDSNSGAVYLYMYNIKLERFGGYVQRITAASISRSLNGFGSSLSIPEDIDNNDTPDVVIGSYKSGHAVVLRTRPKIHIKGGITFFSVEGHAIQVIHREASQFYIKSCFSISEKLGVIGGKVDVSVRVKIFDPAIRFHPNLVVLPNNTENEIFYRKSVDAYDKRKNCEDLNIESVHKHGIGMDDSRDVLETLEPFEFTQDVWYQENLNGHRSILNYYATEPLVDKDGLGLNSFDARKPSSEMDTITAELEIDHSFCNSDVCKPTPSMSWYFYNENNESISFFRLGSSKVLKLRLIVSNSASGETTKGPSLTLQWNNREIVENPSGSRWLHRSCNETSKGNLATFGCPLKRYFRKGQNIIIDIEFLMKDIFVTQSSPFPFTIIGTLRFQDKRIENTPFIRRGQILIFVPTITISIMGSRESSTLSSPLMYTTKSLNKANSNDEEQIMLYSPIRQRFTMEVLGGSVDQVVTQFKIPVNNPLESSNPSQVILVKEAYTSWALGISCFTTSPNSFHKIDLVVIRQDIQAQSSSVKATSDIHVRSVKKRDLGENDGMLISTGNQTTINALPIDINPLKRPAKQDKIVVHQGEIKMSCEDTEAICLDVTCTINKVKERTPVHVSFELYIIKDAIDKIMEKSGKSSLLIESTGFAYMFNGSTHHEDSDVAQISLEMISDREVEKKWYIIAGVVGILILALMVLGLYKCGFFKREKRQQLNNMKAEHKRRSMISTRASMMMQPTTSTSDYLSFEDLLETEQQKGDKEPDKIPDDK